MDKYRVLYNPLACNNAGLDKARELCAQLDGDSVFEDITKIDDILAFLNDADENEKVVIAGGDGTLNRLINDLDGATPERDLYYYPCGSGNDFMADVADKTKGKLVHMNKYLENLPVVTVNDKSYRFLNGIGYGIDGYCCEVGDAMRASDSSKDINYTSIAIKGLLFHYKPVNATIIVDGVEHKYNKVWLAPTMNGRFYGGGMMVAPEQDRLNADGKLSVVIMYGSGKLKTLMVFPNIFKGKHVEHTEMVEVLTGKEISVTFDNPTALQIDGETIVGVTSYSAKSVR